MFWDFVCDTCDAREVDYWAVRSQRPATLPCDCGAAMRLDLGGYRGGIDLTNPAMYGKFHPGFGKVINSYGEKQQELRRTGMVESSDRTGGSRTYAPSEPNKKRPKDPVAWSG